MSSVYCVRRQCSGDIQQNASNGVARSHCFYCLCNCYLLLYLRIVLALAEICFCRVYSQSTFILIKFLYFVAQCIVKAFFGKVSRYIALSLPSSQLLHCRGASAQLAITGTVAIVIVIQKRRPPTPHFISGVGVVHVYKAL